MHRLVLLLTLSIGLAACETTSSNETTDPLSPAAVPAATDAVARYAVDASPGASAPVISGAGSSIVVQVGSYYTSALGERCRRVVLSDGFGRSQVSAVCLVDNGWTTVVGL
ncbi:DVU3141 family protein [Parvibaculum sp.]|jgi:hypothetical protein|uniref:DVU3141 family protein n=1 Tax=Parvibaculum sp. TaxID=2024848 RepID=UPI001B176399|nr:hypothetical protein [Parvibaculum sp.]MBO6678728.1 hypothetical protein [Parvibaculum sp.]MBO6685369.1 hypothetical protein [Parvibaculum sp.]MBO6905574.1 hypothetical protein [Parvibaculum sp.]